jgi:hypothetical protein
MALPSTDGSRDLECMVCRWDLEKQHRPLGPMQQQRIPPTGLVPMGTRKPQFK